ncbi:hypothetical protein VPH35_067853 [Triticum aestivum]
MPGVLRTTWPELVGQSDTVAIRAIHHDRPELRVIEIMVGDPAPPNFENDRVLLWLIATVTYEFVVHQCKLRDMPGVLRTTWPELLSTTDGFAMRAIHHDRPELRIIEMMDGDPPPPNFENDRVILWVTPTIGFDLIVSQVPTVG